MIGFAKDSDTGEEVIVLQIVALQPFEGGYVPAMVLVGYGVGFSPTGHSMAKYIKLVDLGDIEDVVIGKREP